MNPKHLSRNRLAALVLACFAAPPALAIVTYPGDPGTLGDPASWRTPEFLRDWGLRSVGAEFAYAAGYSGAGIKVGMVDSGYFDAHPELSASRFNGVTSGGIPGAYNPAYNDRHGTHVVGTVAAARDGGSATTNMHGVAFNATVYVGNTGKTDAAIFGIQQTSPVQTAAQTIDQAHVANVYRAVNAQGVRIIGSSWGSQPNTEQYDTLLASTALPSHVGRVGLLGAWEFLSRNDTWLAGAIDAARSGTAIMFSAGNSGNLNASPRSGAGYYLPELENIWTAVTGIRQNLTIGGVPVGQSLNPDGSVNVPGAQLYNQCGVSKWSCVSAPGNGINGTNVTTPGGVPTAGYASLSGTSMAQPHATGVLAVIMERFSYMTNEQAISVMRTTAIQNGTINDANGVAIANPEAGQRVAVPDSRNGWGTVSLKYAMNGPGQFTGNFAVNTQGQNDTWSNDISDVAIRARKAEDMAEAAAWAARKTEKGWNAGLPAGATLEERTEYTVSVAREEARNGRVYEGSLSKYGAGALALSGNNSYTGGTHLYGGTLIGRSANAFGTGDMTLHGGMLAGSTTIAGSLLNEAGVLSPGEDGFGTLSVLGSFAQFPAGTLDFEVGNGGMDLLQVGGTAFFGGTLDVSFLAGFSGTGLYTLVSTDDYLGRFSSVNISGLASGYTAALLYSMDGVQLNVTAVPEPGTYAMLLAGLAAVGSIVRRRRA